MGSYNPVFDITRDYARRSFRVEAHTGSPVIYPKKSHRRPRIMAFWVAVAATAVVIDSVKYRSRLIIFKPGPAVAQILAITAKKPTHRPRGESKLE